MILFRQGVDSTKEKKKNIRGIISICLIFGVFTAFALTLFNMQIINGDAYAAKGNSVSEKNVSIKAARGEVLDRNGNPLITNRQGQSIVFKSAYFPPAKEQEQRDKIIISLIRLVEAKKEPWIDNLPLKFAANGTIVFEEKRESDIAQMKSKDMLNLNEYATAQNCFDALIERYKLAAYSKQDARKIASVCYEMKRLTFSISSPYTFAEDVSKNTVSKIKENSSFYKGVDADIVTFREYTDGTLAPHILGMVGAISAEEYAEKKDEGYRLNDTIGKNGIESAMEKVLRGTDGVETVTTDINGKTTTAITEKPVQGNTVVLTIDRNLQKASQNALEKILLAEDTAYQPAGAAIVINCNNGEILASVSYPTYDVSGYRKNYTMLSEASGSPLWNRTLLSTYECGSTMKPSVAIAALEEGIITKSDTFYCSGLYKFRGMTFKCEQSHASRNVNVVSAIKESCNSFFYEMGKRLDPEKFEVDKINEYRTKLGLGQKTGVELAEASGTLDSPSYRQALGQEWMPGFAIQSAIGQGANLFTPIQLANYCATIANGGTRYTPHFVKTVKTYDYSGDVEYEKPAAPYATGFKKETLDIVRRGMYLVGTQGFCSAYFAVLPVEAAAKTGTSQIEKRINGVKTVLHNGLVISYAPADKPEIAIAVVAEGFDSGTKSSQVAAEIYKYYFANKADVEAPQDENTLLG